MAWQYKKVLLFTNIPQMICGYIVSRLIRIQESIKMLYLSNSHVHG
jgi:hypothetical protein